jgi:hypothetical protein
MKPKPARRGGWSGGRAPDGRAEMRWALGTLLVGGLAVGLACWVILTF